MDVFGRMNSMIVDLVRAAQVVGFGLLAYSLLKAGIQYFVHGAEGFREAKGTIIAGIVGFILVVGSVAIASYLKTKLYF